MLRYYLLITFFLHTLSLLGQKKNFQEIAISQLSIWNNTTINDVHSGARARNKTGNSWSNGINVNYSIGLQKNIYANVGLGYFNQRFGIHRGFDYYEPNAATGLFYTTKSYSYKSLQYFGGLGYRRSLSGRNKDLSLKKPELRLLLLYNVFNTFKQEFRHDFSDDFLDNPNPQIRKRKYCYGYSFTLNGGFTKPVFKNFKIGLDLVIPVYNKWRKDVIFKENTNEYHGADFSFGTSINFIYNLN